MATITIVGSGMMGSALAFPASENGHEVRLCGTHLDEDIIRICKEKGRHPRFDRDFEGAVSFYYFSELKKAIAGADLVICGVNSFGVDWFYQEVLRILPSAIPVLSVTKGLHADEDGTLISFPQYWERLLGDKEMSINAIGGPCICFELPWRENTIVTYCGKNLKTLQYIKELMQTSTYHVRISKNVLAIETAVALKNAYTLGVAFTVGACEKKYGDGRLRYNEQAAMFYQGTKEMYRLIEYLTGSGEHIETAAGDMYVTVFGGRTRLLGSLLGKGEPLETALKELSGETLESIAIIGRVATAIEKLEKRGKIDARDYPLMLFMNKVLKTGAMQQIPWGSFVV